MEPAGHPALTRSDIREPGPRLPERDLLRDILPEGRDLLPEGRDLLRDSLPEGRDLLPEGRDLLRDSLPEVRDSLPEVRDSLPEGRHLLRDILPEVRDLLRDILPEGRDLLRDSLSAETEYGRGERHTPGGGNERAHLTPDRPYPGGDNERDHPTAERHPPTGENKRDHPSERHPPRGENERDLPSERHPPRGDNKRALPSERHPPRGDNKRALPSAETHSGGGSHWGQSMDGGHTHERASPPSEPGHPGRAGYWGDRQPAGSYDRMSVERAHTMKDFEKQITELKKENFNLKLRIYFLEEQTQRRGDSSSDELQRMNIELKVEVESLKHDFQEKHKLLVRASKAMESLAGEHGSAVQRLRDQHQRQLQDLEQPLHHNIHHLQEELAHKKGELEKICALLDQERLQRFSAEEGLLALKEQYAKSMAVLEERDWLVQCLNETLRSKDTLIAQLESQSTKATLRATTSRSVGTLFPEDATRGIDLVTTSPKGEEVNEWRERLRERDNLIHDLQRQLEANNAASTTAEKNSLKRDKAIQGLTLTLKTKNKEHQKLLNQIDHLNAALARARESAQLQSVKENIDPEYNKLLFTLQSEQEMYSRLLAYERDSSSLQKERNAIDMLRRWLEDSIQANQELRRIMEAQIMARSRNSDTFSCLGDQTSYLSICLDHYDPNHYHLAGEQHWKKIHKRNSSVAEHGEDFSLVLVQDGLPCDGHLPALTQTLNSKDHVDYPLRLSGNESSAADDDDPDTTLTQPTHAASGCREYAVTSSQTEPVYYSDKSTLVDVCSFDGKKNDIDSVCKELSLKASKSHSHPSAKTSRLPVLSKYSANIKSRTHPPTQGNHESPAEVLQIEDGRLCDTLKRAESDIESLKANEEKPDENTSDQEDIERRPSEQSSPQELQMGHNTLKEQLHGAATETEKLNKALERFTHHVSHMSDVDKVERGSSQQALQQTLQKENTRLSEQLQEAQNEIERLHEKAALERHTETVCSPNTAERDSIEQTSQQKLQKENTRLSEQLQHAQNEIERLREKEALERPRTETTCSPNTAERDSIEQTLQQKLQRENTRLSEQLQHAQNEIERLHEREALERRTEVMCSPNTAERDSSEETLQQKLQRENTRLSEQLQHAQKEIERLHEREALERPRTETTCSPNTAERDSSELTLQQKLQRENTRLSEQLQHAQNEIERLREKEALERRREVMCSPNTAERDSSEETLQQKLQKENTRLSEQLQHAQNEIERLREKEALERRREVMCSPNTADRDSIEQTLQQKLQRENTRLSEQLQQAENEIERLKSDRGVRPIDTHYNLDNANRPERDSSMLPLQQELQMDNNPAHINHETPDNSTANDTYYPELSFLDKTITDFINAKETCGEKSDVVLDVCLRTVESENVLGIHCQHHNYCAECARNRDDLLLQTSTSKRTSGVRERSQHFPKGSNSGRSFEDTTSLSKYDLLVQSQARELSLQRRRIKESHNLSIICTKNFFNILKAFKHLLPTSDLDSNIALAFQEQLSQTIEWLKELEYKLSDAFYGEEDAYSDHSMDSLLYTPSRLVPGDRMWADKRGCHVLGLVEDYNALRKQILEATSVLQETEAFVDHGVQTALLNMTEHFGNIFFEKLGRTKQSLEEANCLLKLLWRVSLPFHDPYSIHQEEETSLEITRLRKRVVEQEKLLSGMMKRVYSENQMKEDIEKLILDQLAVTHDILKRAKGNLEVQAVDKRQ